MARYLPTLCGQHKALRMWKEPFSLLRWEEHPCSNLEQRWLQLLVLEPAIDVRGYQLRTSLTAQTLQKERGGLEGELLSGGRSPQACKKGALTTSFCADAGLSITTLAHSLHAPCHCTLLSGSSLSADSLQLPRRALWNAQIPGSQTLSRSLSLRASLENRQAGALTQPRALELRHVPKGR